MGEGTDAQDRIERGRGQAGVYRVRDDEAHILDRAAGHGLVQHGGRGVHGYDAAVGTDDLCDAGEQQARACAPVQHVGALGEIQAHQHLAQRGQTGITDRLIPVGRGPIKVLARAHKKYSEETPAFKLERNRMR